MRQRTWRQRHHQYNPSIAYYSIRALGKTDDTPRYYVYLLIDPISNTTFYVGKGCNGRMLKHVKDVEKGKLPNGNNGKLFRHIKSILDKGLELTYEKPQENITEVEALALEAAFIDFYGLDNLCNYQVSGFGCNNHMTEEAKERLRQTAYYGNVKQHPTFYVGIRYIDKVVVPQLREEAKQQKRQLKEDLKLLGEVIGDMRKALIEKEVEDNYTSIGIVTLDKDKHIYERRCPTCSCTITHKTLPILLKSARLHRVCYSCGMKQGRKTYWSKIPRKIKPPKIVRTKREQDIYNLQRAIEGVQKKNRNANNLNGMRKRLEYLLASHGAYVSPDP